MIVAMRIMHPEPEINSKFLTFETRFPQWWEFLSISVRDRLFIRLIILFHPFEYVQYVVENQKKNFDYDLLEWAMSRCIRETVALMKSDRTFSDLWDYGYSIFSTVNPGAHELKGNVKETWFLVKGKERKPFAKKTFIV